jgi:hypothetical protein
MNIMWLYCFFFIITNTFIIHLFSFNKWFLKIAWTTVLQLWIHPWLDPYFKNKSQGPRRLPGIRVSQTNTPITVYWIVFFVRIRTHYDVLRVLRYALVPEKHRMFRNKNCTVSECAAVFLFELLTRLAFGILETRGVLDVCVLLGQIKYKHTPTQKPSFVWSVLWFC